MSVRPARLTFTIQKGATFREQIRWWQDAAHTVPADLTGYSAELRIYDSGGEVIETLTVGGGIEISGNVIEIVLSEEETDALDWSVAGYDLFTTLPSGDTILPLTGSLKVPRNRR